MNRAFCIYPKDLTTDFLGPIFNELIENNEITGVAGDSSDDEFYDKMSFELNNKSFDVLFFLGHGCSSQLYGNRFSTLIPKDELKKLSHKTIILFSCNSSMLLENIDARRGIGFGFIPSGVDDVSNPPLFHNLDLSQLDLSDWEYLRQAYQKCWLRSITGILDIFDIHNLYKRLDFFFNRAIVEALQSDSYHNQLISDIIYLVKREMKLFMKMP